MTCLVAEPDQCLRTSSNFFLNRTFNDVDDLITASQNWDVDFWQLEKGQFQGKILQAITPSWQLSHATFSRALKQQGLPPSHLRNIVIPANSRQQVKWRGHSTNGNNVRIFPLGSDYESISDENLDVFIVAISEAQLSHLCEFLDLPDLPGLTQGTEVIDCTPAAINRLSHQLHQISQQLTLNPALLTQPNFADALEFEFAQHLLLTLNQGQIVAPAHMPRRQSDALKIAEAYIRAHVDQPLTVRNLCAQVNVSERTLRTAFYDRYGISPKAYLKHFQLTQVRRQLRQADPTSTTVCDIANAFGFWHMGQFSKDYARLFGERPAETLRRP